MTIRLRASAPETLAATGDWADIPTHAAILIDNLELATGVLSQAVTETPEDNEGLRIMDEGVPLDLTMTGVGEKALNAILAAGLDEIVCTVRLYTGAPNGSVNELTAARNPGYGPITVPLESVLSRLSVFDSDAPVTADGTSGIWWRASGTMKRSEYSTSGNDFVEYDLFGNAAEATGPRDVALPTALLDGGVTAYIGRFLLFVENDGTSASDDEDAHLRLSLTPDDPNAGQAAGPDLTTAAESNLRIAVWIGGEEFVLPTIALHGGFSLYCVDSSGDDLWLLDPADPSSTVGNFGLVGSLPTGLTSPQGLASHDGGLYCVDPSDDDLWLLDPADPSSTDGNFGSVGSLPTGLFDPRGLASHDGGLYCVDSTRADLWLLDPTDPSSTVGNFGRVGALPTGLLGARGLASHDGGLYCVDSSGDDLWLLDPTDPSSTVGNFGRVGSLCRPVSPPRRVSRVTTGVCTASTRPMMIFGCWIPPIRPARSVTSGGSALCRPVSPPRRVSRVTEGATLPIPTESRTWRV